MKKAEFILIIPVGAILMFYAGTLGILAVVAFLFRKNILAGFKKVKNKLLKIS